MLDSDLFPNIHAWDKQRNCNRLLDFFPVNNFVHGTIKIRNSKYRYNSRRFEFFCLSGKLDLVVTNTPGTTKIFGSNLAGPVFFKRDFFFQLKKFG